MTTTADLGAVKTAQTEREPLKLRKRIGSTVFIVTVHFSNTSTDKPEDIIQRLIEREVDKIA